MVSPRWCHLSKLSYCLMPFGLRQVASSCHCSPSILHPQLRWSPQQAKIRRENGGRLCRTLHSSSRFVASGQIVRHRTERKIWREERYGGKKDMAGRNLYRSRVNWLLTRYTKSSPLSLSLGISRDTYSRGRFGYLWYGKSNTNEHLLTSHHHHEYPDPTTALLIQSASDGGISRSKYA